MPFTISHAAVVLPFARLLVRWRLLSAFVIGAMVPDFGLFFPWRMHRFETHSALALLTFCLPVGLTTYWAFQYLIKAPMLEVLPEGAYARWRPFSSPADFASIRQWVLAGCGVLTGAVTHLVLGCLHPRKCARCPHDPLARGADRRDRQSSHGGSPAHAGRQFAIRAGCRGRIGLVRLACRVGVPRARSPPAAAGAPRVGGSLYRCRDWLERCLAALGARRRTRGAPSYVAGIPVSPWRRFVAWPLHCCLPVSPLTGVCARWLSAARTEHRSL